ncbi:ankyrin repeat-containing domain protein [Ilyonectria robusta]|uniref:ankyrin repeat-containing domain protein n=1 Tax=Ilyonectria robusta TaxID=1079257 RepID=UPI001E8E5222|nr:ankyrin repeat-containing domain protein [Ilyonectria robusta]KAH8652892.1 ankyrin repeat-containing domain protein [Ilyonectria robusta]
MDASREWHMLRFMAKAFVQDWKGVLEAFHEVGWDLSRRHFYYKRSLLYYVVEHAECIGPVDILLDSGADLSPCSDGSVVKRLIAAGARVRAKDRGFGGTPLVGAIQGGKTANARVLLEAGSDVNHVLNVDGKRRTLLHLAAQDGILEMMQLLLDWKANPNILDEMGGSPAQWAARDNHAEAVRILLAGGLDPNFDKGYSLRIALSLGHLEVAKLLLQHGAKVDLSVITAARDKTVYKGDRIPFFQLCVENIKHNDCETNSSRAYIDLNDKFTLDMGAKNLHIPTIMNGRHGRPNDFRLAAAFVKHGVGTGLADLEEVSRALLICLFGLLKLGNPSGTILRYSVRPDGWTALHIAAHSGNTAMTELLHGHGWSLTQEDIMGRSVLDLGVFNGNLELVQKLLAAHCTAEHRDRDGNSPMHFAVSGAGGQNKLLLECLDAARCSVSKANAIRETALHLAARLDRGGATEWLLGKGATVGATDQFLNTPLHIAASFNILSAIEILINSGGNVNQAAVDGRTPLHCASQAGAGGAVMALLGAGADPNQADSRGRTALITAIDSGACEPDTVDALFARTTVDWTAPRLPRTRSSLRRWQRCLRTGNTRRVWRTEIKHILQQSWNIRISD